MHAVSDKFHVTACKGQGEISVFRTLWDFFRPGDVVLTDRLYCTWRELLTLQQRGVDSVTQLQAMRKADFRTGKRLGKEDHIVRWKRPSIRSLSWRAQKLLPAYLTVRECRIHVEQAGFRTDSIVVVTTLLAAEQFTKEDLAAIYFRRWNVEFDLRSVKQTLQMDILRCKTPELVRKEIWTHILAYHLIRTIMAQAATECGMRFSRERSASRVLSNSSESFNGSLITKSVEAVRIA